MVPCTALLPCQQKVPAWAGGTAFFYHQDAELSKAYFPQRFLFFLPHSSLF